VTRWEAIRDHRYPRGVKPDNRVILQNRRLKFTEARRLSRYTSRSMERRSEGYDMALPRKAQFAVL